MEPGLDAGDPYEDQRRQYEFDDQENATFRDLSEAMRTVSVAMMVLGPLRVIFGGVAAYHGDYANGASQVVEGVCFFLIGNWTSESARSILRIVQTKGADISHLMSSMVDLKKIYRLQRTVMVIAIAVVALGLIVGFVSTLKPDAPAPPKVTHEEINAPPPAPPPPVAPAVVAPPPAPAPAAVAAPPPPPAPAPAPAAHGKATKKHPAKKHKR